MKRNRKKKKFLDAVANLLATSFYCARPEQMKKKFYLDWAFISDAATFAITGKAEYESDKKLELVKKISEEHTLVLSTAHLFDMCRSGNKELMLQRAQWLDTIKVQWIKSCAELEEIEWEWGLESFATQRAIADVEIPFTNSFLRAVVVQPQQLAEVLHKATIYNFVQQVGNTARGQQQAQSRVSQISSYILEAFERDLELTKKAASEEEVMATIETQRKMGYEGNISRTYDSWTVKLPYEKLRMEITPKDKFISDVVAHSKDKKELFPLSKVKQHHYEKLRQLISKKQKITPKFKEKESGFFIDGFHLVGAAYCDVFMCDHWTFRTLEGAPVKAQVFENASWKELSSMVD